MITDEPFAQAAWPGNPTPEQLSILDDIAEQDERARVIGWHYPSGGPLVVRSNGLWQSVLPEGVERTLARSTISA